MLKIILIGTALIVGITAIVFLTQAPQTSPRATVAQPASIATIKDDVANGGQLIDVRTPTEFADGHIDGSINLSLQAIQQGVLPTADKNQPLYVYCRSGSRSAEAASLLKAAGYTQVTDLGAIEDVEAAGGVVVQ